MSIHVALNHVTRYRYDRPVTLVAAAGASASGSALPHADPVLLAARHAGRALHQLAAGSAEQLHRAAHVPGAGPRALASRSTSWPRWPSTIRSTSSSSRPPSLPLLLRGLAAARAAAVPADRAADAAFAEYLGSIDRSRRRTIDALVDINRQLQQRHPLRHPARSRRADGRADAGAGVRFVPRHDVAARSAASPSGDRRAVRVGLPDSAHGRHQADRRSGRARSAISPICTPGAKPICPAPAGLASIPPRACSPARDTCRSPARPIRLAPRP